jgi:hypothetical protein
MYFSNHFEPSEKYKFLVTIQVGLFSRKECKVFRKGRKNIFNLVCFAFLFFAGFA